MEIIGADSRGPAVEDIQRRLAKLGYDIGPEGVDGVFADATAAAVRAFRRDHGLTEGEVIDALAWAALVDASFTLGDRTLYLRMPYFHGNDVSELQHILNILGFACGPQDSIFGAYTERAVRDFQTNMGIEPDGIAGASTYRALTRLHRAWSDKNPINADASGLGFSRAADVLEGYPVCVYGVGPISREIASRISNLAFATTSASKVVSPDAMSGVPDPTMLFVEIDAGESDEAESDGRPIVEYADAATLNMRFATAVSSLSDDSRRVIVRVDIPEGNDAEPSDVVNESSRRGIIQHNAILILDAICSSFS